MDTDALLSHLRREISAFGAALDRALARDGGLDLPVEACDEWTVRDLAHHLGEVQRWVVHAIETGTGHLDQPPPPADDELAGWWSLGSARLLEALAADPATPAWALAEPQTVGFWQRRQCHEHAVHRWDLETALGEVSALDAELAEDGVAEVVDVMWPRQVSLGRTEVPQHTVELRATDTDRSWLLGNGDPVATVSGATTDLMLVLWHRLDPDASGLAWEGEPEEGHAILALPLAP